MSTRVLITIYLVLLASAAVFAIWYSLGSPGLSKAEVATEGNIYRSADYGYSFSYVPPYELKEYSSQSLALGTSTSAGFVEHAAVNVIKTSVRRDSFEAFAEEAILALCASENTARRTECSAVSRKAPVTSLEGSAGMEYYLTLSLEDMKGGTESSTTYGPVYAFDISANAPEAAMSALVLYPPVDQFLAHTIDVDLVSLMAQGVRIDNR